MSNMRNAVAVSNTAMSHHKDKSFDNGLLNNDPKITMTTSIITNIPMLPCFQNGGDGDVPM